MDGDDLISFDEIGPILTINNDKVVKPQSFEIVEEFEKEILEKSHDKSSNASELFYVDPNADKTGYLENTPIPEELVKDLEEIEEEWNQESALKAITKYFPPQPETRSVSSINRRTEAKEIVADLSEMFVQQNSGFDEKQKWIICRLSDLLNITPPPLPTVPTHNETLNCEPCDSGHSSQSTNPIDLRVKSLNDNEKPLDLSKKNQMTKSLMDPKSTVFPMVKKMSSVPNDMLKMKSNEKTGSIVKPLARRGPMKALPIPVKPEMGGVSRTTSLTDQSPKTQSVGLRKTPTFKIRPIAQSTPDGTPKSRFSSTSRCNLRENYLNPKKNSFVKSISPNVKSNPEKARNSSRYLSNSKSGDGSVLSENTNRLRIKNNNNNSRLGTGKENSVY